MHKVDCERDHQIEVMCICMLSSLQTVLPVAKLPLWERYGWFGVILSSLKRKEFYIRAMGYIGMLMTDLHRLLSYLGSASPFVGFDDKRNYAVSSRCPISSRRVLLSLVSKVIWGVWLPACKPWYPCAYGVLMYPGGAELRYHIISLNSCLIKQLHWIMCTQRQVT